MLFDDGDDDDDSDDVVTAAARDGQPSEVAQRHVQLNSHSVTHSSVPLFSLQSASIVSLMQLLSCRSFITGAVIIQVVDF